MRSRPRSSATSLWVNRHNIRPRYGSTYLSARLFHDLAAAGGSLAGEAVRKTTLLDVLACLVMKALPTANVSAAALFRVVESYRPTLLVDEADTFLAGADDLRGVLNSGHRRGGNVLRTVGDDRPRASPPDAAVAIALSELPDTLADRSIPIDLKRKLASEVIESFRVDRVGHLEVLARKAARWAADNAVQIAAADPDMPPGVHSREADNWRPLFAIAEAAGGEWPRRARAAATQAAAASETESHDRAPARRHPGNLRQAGGEQGRAGGRIAVRRLVAALVGSRVGPGPSSARPASRLPRTGWPGCSSRWPSAGQYPHREKCPQGYHLERFKETSRRYLGRRGLSNRYTARTPMKWALLTVPKRYRGNRCSG